MKKWHYILVHTIFFFGVLKGQLPFADDKGNMCIKNYEHLRSSSTQSINTYNIEFVDITGNLYKEAVFLNRADQKLLYAKNNAGDPTLEIFENTFNTIFDVPNGFEGNIATGDFNGDGRNDIIVCNAFGNLLPLVHSGYSTIINFDSVGLGINPWGLTPFKTYVFTMRENKDALPDLLLIGNRVSGNNYFDYEILRNTTTPTSTNITFSSVHTGSILTGSVITNFNFDLVVADADNDGDDEIFFVSEQTKGEVRTLLNIDIGFVEIPSVPQGNDNYRNKRIKYLDVNADGAKEIVLLTQNISPPGSYVTYWLPGFSAANTYTGINQYGASFELFDAEDVAFVDFSRDKLPDLALSKKQNNQIILRKQIKSTGYLFEASAYTYTMANATAGKLYAGDLDRNFGNTAPDLVSIPTTSIASRAAIFRNFTQLDSLIAIPSKTAICVGENITIQNKLSEYTPPLLFYSSLTNTWATAVSQTISISGPTVIPSVTNLFLMFSINNQTCTVHSNSLQIFPAVHPTLSITAPDKVCKDEPVDIYMNGQAVSSYTWAGYSFMNSPLTATFNTEKEIVVYGHSPDGCRDSAKKTIQIAPDFSVTITSVPEKICPGKQATLSVTGANSYSWSTGFIGQFLPVVQTGSLPVLFSILAFDEYGCEQIVTYSTNVNDGCSQILITNGITPNNDGKNDFFFIENIEYYPDNKVIIYNRWGKELFNQKGYDNREVVWPQPGANLTPGTYYYFLELGNGSEIAKGWLEVLD